MKADGTTWPEVSLRMEKVAKSPGCAMKQYCKDMGLEPLMQRKRKGGYVRKEMPKDDMRHETD